MNTNKTEFLVTGQAYEKTDPYKQTIILHDTFFASSENEAKHQFGQRFEDMYEIITIYSAIGL